MNDPEARRRLVDERQAILRAEAARERLIARGRAPRRARRSARVALGLVIVRIGRSISGDGRPDETPMVCE